MRVSIATAGGAAGLLFQGLALVAVIPGRRVAWALAALAVAALAALAVARRRWVGPILGASIGGAGMLLGSRLDLWRRPAAPPCHADTGSVLGSAMLWGMLLGCAAACIWLEPRCHARARRGPVAALLPHAGMLVGMFAGGAGLGPPLVRATGSAFAGHHLAMVVGMLLGSLAGGAAPGPLLRLTRPRGTHA